MKKYLNLIVLIIFVGLFLFSRNGKADYNDFPKVDETELDTGTVINRNYEVALTDNDVSSEIIERKGYTVSYNSSWKIPNWVAWELICSEVGGEIERPTIDFRPDPNVKKSAVHKDYTRSGYDRGHMFPAGDAHWDYDVMQESFYLSNICPQAPNLNRGVWERLEEHCRYLAQYGNLYICCGPIVGPVPIYGYIGENKVVVPDGFFKALCMKRNGRWIGIAFVFPNDDEKCKSLNMANQVVKISELEVLVKHDFFTNLSDSIKDDIKSQCNFKDWQ